MILDNESDVCMSPPKKAALLVKVLLMILSDVRNVHMIPPQAAALLLVKVLLTILHDESYYNTMTPPLAPTLLALLLIKVVPLILNESLYAIITPP